MPKTISSLPTGAINKTDSIITATDGSDELKRNTVDELLAEPTADISALQTENENLKAQIAEMEEEISELNSDLNSETSYTISSDYSYNATMCVKVGNVVNFRIQCNSGSFDGTNAILGVMPEECRPRSERIITGSITVASDPIPTPVRIASNGQITERYTTNTFTAFRIAGTYPI